MTINLHCEGLKVQQLQLMFLLTHGVIAKTEGSVNMNRATTWLTPCKQSNMLMCKVQQDNVWPSMNAVGSVTFQFWLAPAQSAY